MLENLPFMIIGASVVLTSSPILFVLFIFLNRVLNYILKNAIQQKRPKECDKSIRHSYGMPSGHSQDASFAMAFVWFEVTKLQQYILLILILITLTQRVVSNCHSVAQVVAGLIVGVVFGILCYRLTLIMKEKRDVTV